MSEARILIVEVNWIGDILFSTPAIRAIRAKNPGAYIAALVVPRGKPLLLGNNYLDEVIVLDEEGRYRGFFGKIRLIRDLASRKFTSAYVLRPSLTRTFWLFLAGIKKRTGFDRKGRFFLTERVPMPDGVDWHRADIYYFLVMRDRIPQQERRCDFFVAPPDRIFVDRFLEKNAIGRNQNKIVVLHVGGNWDLKRWPVQHFASLVDGLAARYGADMIITGLFLDYPLAKEIMSAAHHKVFNACGQTNLKQLGVLFQKCDLVISADSGPLHIAMAMNARTISLFGPTSVEATGPMGHGPHSVLRPRELACPVPCYETDCPDNRCMKAITVEQVLEEVERLGWLNPATT
jgi:lipopolysaccharide heptosyltransferase II